MGRVKGDVDITGAFGCRRLGRHAVSVMFSKDFWSTSDGFFKQRFQHSWGAAAVAESVKEEFNLGDPKI